MLGVLGYVECGIGVGKAMNLLSAPQIAGLLPTLTPAMPDSVHDSEFFQTCARMADRSVDMVLCDLPYGTTACSWDVIIPFEPMWKEFKRIIKPRGAIVLTASQPFTTLLISSNIAMFKYTMVWEKTVAANFFNAKNKPLAFHEDICIFSFGTTANRSPNLMNYFPQGLKKTDTRWTRPQKYFSEHRFARDSNKLDRVIEYSGYPGSIIKFSNGNNESIHPTQKPVALFAYLIRTYTRPGELVFDPCCGSGTTALAARNEGRRYIVGDNGTDERTGKRWAQIIQERLAEPFTLNMFTQENHPPIDVSQSSFL
jgi:site-specific DNA-methyltransferase (adenine-specific)